MSIKFKNCPQMQYSPEQLQFLKESVKGRSYTKLATMFNEHWGTDLNRHAISEVCRYYGFSGDEHSHFRYSDEHIQFLRDNVQGHYYYQLTELFNEHFNTNLGIVAIRETCRHYGINNNRLQGGFQKGNKCRKKPLPDGSENVNVVGYHKIKRNGIWIGKHVAVWEEANGTVPEGHYIVFGDGDKDNLSLDNLYCVSAMQGGIRSQMGLKGDTPELAEAGIALAGLYATINKRENKKKRGYKAKKTL